ncbi:sensor histidine kinase [Peribacillus acanthi]|uniref:sensor histidine kinase n=1 Tax=Peribacillus acanthi TaxID=2171554 RepID=UPI000D3EDCF5|nr:HAMP domain-containing sensor histidine kinase [Peribacillus acanthi]
MSILIKDFQTFLLNTFFVFTFFYLYTKIIERKMSPIINEILIIIISGFSILLSMSFPLELSEGNIFDMRQVPFIIGALYGGRRVAVILFFILVGFRFYLDGQGLYGAFTVSTLLLISLWFIIPSFIKTVSMKKRIYLATLSSLLGLVFLMLIVFLLSSEIVNQRYLSFIIPFFIAQSIAIILFVNFIEKSKLNAAVAREIRKLEKLKTVSDMGASIAHEIRNPLTVTKGFVQLMRNPELTSDEKKLYIDFAIAELDRAEHIISDYLTFAKPTLENIEILELNKHLDFIIQIVNPYATMNNVQLKVQIEDDIYVAGEKQKLQQCIVNIIKNGIESMESGGIIEISLKKNNGTAELKIKDSGNGMNEEQIDRLGTPFYSTKDKGTGLGTMVVYSIVKAMRGDIKVESEVGIGTCFTINFPIVDKS